VSAGALPSIVALDAARDSIAAEAALATAQGRLLVAAYRLRAITALDDAR